MTPPQTGKYTLYVEVVGRFLLSFQEKVLLTGRSLGATPKRFKSGILSLKYKMFYELILQYTLDPQMPEETDPAPMPRHVRLLWQSDDFTDIHALEPVPPTVLRHSFTPLYGYPTIATLVNDPQPCGGTVLLHNLPFGYVGTIATGGGVTSYNANLDCQWHFTTPGLARFNFIVNFFDVQPSRECTADAVVIRMGLTGDILGTFCGSIVPTGILGTYKGVSFGFQFRTDDIFEGKGFNITYQVVESWRDEPIGPGHDAAASLMR